MENNELKESFLKNWERFITELKGNMLSFADKQPLTNSSASQILADNLFEWKSESNLIGKWLDNLKASNRDKAEKVSDILFKIAYISSCVFIVEAFSTSNDSAKDNNSTGDFCFNSFKSMI